MKVVVTGAKGMLGSVLMEELCRRGISAVGVDRSEYDLTSKQEVLRLITQHQPTHVVNCAAYTNVDGAEQERFQAWNVNVKIVSNLVEICNAYNVRLIQISTDYVFDGTQKKYTEDSKTNPLNVYGQTKAEAEKQVLSSSNDFLIIRTSWLYGKNGKNFVDTINRLTRQKGELSVVNDQFGSPTYTVDLAVAIIRNVEVSSGIYHLTNSGSCSWYEFAQEIVRLNKSNCVVVSCSSTAYQQVAPRPSYSVLTNSKLEALRDWKTALQEYIAVQ